jgi:hypothetical protein
MRILIILIILFALTCCKEPVDKEKEIKTISVSKEFEINGVKDSLIYRIGDLAVTANSSFIITDIIDCKIKLFDKNGIFKSSIGGINDNSDGFRKSPLLLAYDSATKRLAVNGFASDTIKYYDQKLKQIDRLKLPAQIIGIQFDNDSNVITAYPMVSGGRRLINIWDKKGNNISSFNFAKMGEYSTMNIFSFRFSKYLDEIVVTYLFRNLIQIYNKKGDLKKEFSLPFLPDKSETKEEISKTSFGTIQRVVPVHRIFQDVAVDKNGKIFLLAGFYSKGGEKKRIYVVDDNGNVLNKIELDTKVSNIYTGNDNSILAVAENRNTIIKYRINEK